MRGLQDLAVLTPSLIVCAAFLAAVFALLRHEMAPGRRTRENARPSEDMLPSGRFSDHEEAPAATSPDHEEEPDQPAGRRSPGQG